MTPNEILKRPRITEKTSAMGEVNGKAASLEPTIFPVTRYPGVCERCAYRALCWETVQ